MKKVLSILFLVSFLAVTAIPLMAGAVTINPNTECKITHDITIPDDDGQGTYTCRDTEDIDGEKSICCVLNTMYSISDWIFVLLVGVAGVFIIIGGMNLVMAAGSPDKVKTGRDYIMYAAIGLFVAFIARAIPGLVLMIIG